MPLPPFIRNPELKERVDLAYEQALRAQGELGGAAVGGAMSMQAGIDALNKETTAAREAGTIPGSRGLELITNPETKQAFETALTNAERLFTRISLTIPTIEQLQAAGVDLTHLAAGYEQMKADELKPQIVLAPVMTKDEARALYTSLTNDRSIPNNPLLTRGSNDGSSDGLWINREITDTIWDDLHDPVFNPLTDSDGAESPVYADSSDRRWTLRIIDGTNNSTQKDSSYNDNRFGNLSISEYLIFQALYIQVGNRPFDISHNRRRTWNNGIFSHRNGYYVAPSSDWEVDEDSHIQGNVRVSFSSILDATYHTVRSSVG